MKLTTFRMLTQNEVATLTAALYSRRVISFRGVSGTVRRVVSSRYVEETSATLLEAEDCGHKFDSDQEKFWLVWSPQGRSPKHETYELAKTEAARLARSNPGHQFYVMGAEHVVFTHDAISLDFDGRTPF